MAGWGGRRTGGAPPDSRQTTSFRSVNLLRAAATISGLTLMSRVTGLAREILQARIFGAGADMDAYNVAFRLPNLLRRMFAEGAFSQAFVPILAEVQAREGEERVRALLSHVASALFWVLLGVSILGVLAAPVLVWVIASGLARDPGSFTLAAQLTRVMFPYILFMSLVAFAAGVLNSFHRYVVPAFTPVLLNVALIVAAVFGTRHVDPPILALAIGVIVGGALQLAIQIPALSRIGKLPRIGSLRAALADAGVQRIVRKMLPALFAVSVAQLSIIINTSIASHLGEGRISWLMYADRLMEFPTALLGVALGTVLLPSLSRANAEARADDYSRLLDWGLRLTALAALPAAVGLGLLAEGMLAVLFQGQRFTATDVTQTAYALTGYAVGLFGLIAVKILAPGYYAQQDVKTPVKIAVAVLVATQIANLVLVPWLQHSALALSVSLGACANALALYVGLRRRGVYRPSPGWGAFLLRVVVALALMAAVLWFADQRIHWTALQQQPLVRAGLLGGVIGAAALVYFAALWAMGFRPRDFMQQAR
jgi:putative peptidoglycan lipid II flippase